VFCFVPLLTWHIRHLEIIVCTSRRICGQKKRSATNRYVLSNPKWPANPPSCNSRMMKSRIEPPGTQIRPFFVRYPPDTEKLVLVDVLDYSAAQISLKCLSDA
jgi:hypothetical protein